MAEEQKKQQRSIPLNELDYNMSLTRPMIGSNEANPNFIESLTKEYFQYDRDGNLIFNHSLASCKKNVQVKDNTIYCPFCNKTLTDAEIEPALSKKALWSQLGYFTQDFRLSNLSMGSMWKGEPNEVEYCEYRLNLANDLLSEGYDECFIILLERVAAKTEFCQSKGGFLRKRMGTYTQENKNETVEPAKRTIFPGKGGY